MAQRIRGGIKIMTLLDKMKPSYIAYSQTSVHKRKVEKTKELIKEILSKHKKPYIACSTGKDSLTMLHLIYEIDPNIDVMFHDSGVELPESYEQIKKIEQNWGINLKVVKSPINVLERYKERDGIFFGGKGDIAFTEAMGEPIRKWAKENGYDLAFIGLRQEESTNRRIMLCKNGQYFYCKKYEIYECFPLSFWKKEDIWAYIFTHPPLENLIHPAYYKDRLVKDPGDIRISWYCDPTSARFGQFLWLKIYYPDLFRKLADMFPEIMTYV